MTGQSCKIELFRGALKEFIPGRVIQLKKQGGDLAHDYELKLICLNGAVQYLKDRKYGFADILVKNSRSALPYIVTAFSHTGEEKILIHSLDRENTSGFISRNLENLTLKLYLKDAESKQRYSYSCGCELKDFKDVEFEDVQALYGPAIPQGDMDDIIDNEVRFFVWADPERWGFMVVPILCR